MVHWAPWAGMSRVFCLAHLGHHPQQRQNRKTEQVAAIDKVAAKLLGKEQKCSHINDAGLFTYEESAKRHQRKQTDEYAALANEFEEEIVGVVQIPEHDAASPAAQPDTPPGALGDEPHSVDVTPTTAYSHCRIVPNRRVRPLPAAQ